MALFCVCCGSPAETVPAPALCPKCGVSDAWGTAAVSAPTTAAPSAARSLAEGAPRLRYYSTGHPTVDALLSGGMVAGTSTVLFGQPGGGKSSLALLLASGLAASFRTRAAVLCPEMSRPILVSTATKAGAALELLDQIQPDEWEAGELGGARVLVVDSISKMPRPLETLARVLRWAVKARGVALCLAHTNSKGRPLGPRALEHDPDMVLRLDAKERGGKVSRVLVVEKSRTTPVGSAAL